MARTLRKRDPNTGNAVTGGITKPPVQRIARRAGAPTVTEVKADLKRAREARNTNAKPNLTLDNTGVCRINTGRMDLRSQQEVYNYAFAVNKYLGKQRGGKVKIKSTKKRRDAQTKLCTSVRGANQDMFDTLNSGKQANHKLFSVVAHVPDECIQVHTFENKQNQQVKKGTGGIGEAPGWMPMTRQANSIVSKIGLQTTNTCGQNEPCVMSIEVDGLVPQGFVPIDQWTRAIGSNPFEGNTDCLMDDASSESSSSSESESDSDSD